MSEDKTKTLQGNEKSEADMLREELENLRGTFQQKLDETTREMEHMPVIQELDYGDDSSEEDAEISKEAGEQEENSKEKKKHKKGKVIAVSIAVTLLVLIIGFLGTYVAVSIANPNFNSFVSAYAMGNSAETYEEKIAYYEKAVTFCTDEDSKFQNALKQMAYEGIVSEMYKEKGYSEAYAYMKAHMDDEMISKSNVKEIKDILSVNESIKTFSLSAFETVIKNIGAGNSIPDISVLSAGLAVPAEIKETGEAVLKTIAEGYMFNRSKENIGDALTAVTRFYSSSYSALVAAGADDSLLSQEIVCTLYNHGLVFEAAIFSYIHIDPELAELTNEYSVIKNELSKLADVDIDVIALAEKAINEEKTSANDVKVLVDNALGENTEFSDVFNLLTVGMVEALQYEKDSKLTKAASSYSAVLTSQQILGMNIVPACIRFSKILLTQGDITNFETIYTTYLAEIATESLTSEDKAVYEEISEIYKSYKNILNLCYAELQNLSTDAQFPEIRDKFLAFDTEDRTDIEKGFIYYFIADTARRLNSDEALLYYEMSAELIPEMPFLCAAPLLNIYVEKKNFVEAGELAVELILTDSSIEEPYIYAALSARARGDVDAAVKMAEKGLAETEDSIVLSYEAAIGYLLKGELETAFNYISKFYKNSQPSIELYDIILIYDSLYEGDNDDIKNSLKEMTDNINKLYAENKVESYADTKAVINGEKTLADVFLKDNYSLI